MAQAAGVTRRVTQGERTRATRAILMDAAIDVLVNDGIAGATTVRIQNRAGVSRGRMLHHFRDRESLLVAAVQHLALARFDALRSEESELEGEERIREAIEVLWASYNGPLFWAAVELWIAARHDQALSDALLPEERRLGAVIREVTDSCFGPSLTSHPAYPDLRDTLIASMRGAAMTYTFDRRDMTTDPHLEVWQRLAVAVLSVEPTTAVR